MANTPADDERHGQPAKSAGVEPPFPDEVAGQERQHEETRVADVETDVFILMFVQLQPEERRHLDGHRRSHRKTEGDDGVRSARRSQLSGIRRHEHELLPEAVRVLARELPREGVEVAHALHRHQERFIGREPRIDETRDLLAQMVFQLRDIDRVDRLPAAEVAPPLVDLLLERYRVTWSLHVRLPVAVARLTPRGWPDREWRAPARCPVGSSPPLATARVPRRAEPGLGT